ncbi:MAG: hypothetical protein DYH20_01060 [Gammaproteobacteria bacterium PRO9]|nr:hypothetical protein [Gammaproteobacteria bacterium PRO9]
MTTVDKSISFSVQAAVPGGGGAAPSWVTAIPVGRWAEVVTVNRLADIDPEKTSLNPNGAGSTAPWHGVEGQKGVIDDWNGGVVAQNEYFVFGGGHKGYNGNEVYGLSLSDLTWRRRSDPYPGPADFDGYHAEGWWPAHGAQANGSPIAPHTYRFLQYDPERKCLVLLTTQTQAEPAYSTIPQAAFFPLPGSGFPVYQWQKASRYAGAGAPTAWGGWAAYDTVRKHYLVQGGAASTVMMATFNPAGGSAQGAYGTWTQRRDMNSTTYAVGGYYPGEDCVLMFIGGTGVLRGFSAGALTVGPQVLSQSNTPGTSLKCGFEYSEALNAFVVWSSGASVYKLAKGPGVWNSAVWAWELLTSAGNSVAPSAPNVNGTYNRFSLVKYTDAEVAVLLNRSNENIFAFRVA